MARLEDFTFHLKPGDGEVKILKKEVTDGLANWKKGLWPLPKPGCRASYRRSSLHAYDMGDHYLVHRDRVNPEMDPIGHLVEDSQELILAGMAVAAAVRTSFAFRNKEKL